MTYADTLPSFSQTLLLVNGQRSSAVNQRSMLRWLREMKHTWTTVGHHNYCQLTKWTIRSNQRNLSSFVESTFSLNVKWRITWNRIGEFSTSAESKIRMPVVWILVGKISQIVLYFRSKKSEISFVTISIILFKEMIMSMRETWWFEDSLFPLQWPRVPASLRSISCQNRFICSAFVI